MALIPISRGWVIIVGILEVQEWVSAVWASRYPVRTQAAKIRSYC